MKITIYKLLGLVKDGKAPKKIKTNTGIFKLEIEDDQLRYRCNDGGILTFDYYTENNKLNDEVEIIEEPNKIEKIEIYEDEDGHYFFNNRCKKIYIRYDEIDFMVEKFNELIDEINNLKEK